MSMFVWFALIGTPLQPQPAPPAVAVKQRACECSPQCTCGCHSGKKCRCVVVTGPAAVGPPVLQSRPILQLLRSSGGRPANC